MRIHIVSAVFLPEPVTSATMVGDIAEEMTKRGHEVTVFTSFPNRPSGHLMNGYRRSFRRLEHRDGFRIVRCWHTLSRRSTFLSRLAENISLGVTSTLAMLREPAPDVVYLMSRPIFAKWLGVYASNRRNVPVVAVVKAIYPETIVDSTGGSQRNPLVRLLHFIDTDVCRRSSLTTVLNSSQRRKLIADRGVSPDAVEVYPDWVETSRFPADTPRSSRFREKHGLSPESFLAMYVGTPGPTTGLTLFLETADKIRHRDDIRIVLVGDVTASREVEREAAARDLHNLTVIHSLTPEDVPEVQAAADVLLLSLLPGASPDETPSELILYLFSARPILASVAPDGSPASLISDAHCGYVVAQDDANQLAEKLIEMADNRSSLTRLGQNARRYAELHFARDAALPRLCDTIERIGQRS